MQDLLYLFCGVLEGYESGCRWARAIAQDFKRLLAFDVRVITSARCGNILYRPRMHHKRPELLQGEIIAESSQVEFERGHIEVAVAKLGAGVVKGKHMLCVILVL